MIEIKNLKFDKIRKPYQVRVDRGTIFGNPYYMKREEERIDVCNKYEIYFKQKINLDSHFKAAVMELITIYKTYGKLELFCWCAPKLCHAETIKNYILNYCNENKNKNENEVIKK